MVAELNFTKGAIEKIVTPQKRTKYKDHGGSKSAKGLYLHVGTSGGKVFYHRQKLNGKVVDVRLGNFPALSVENARDKSREAASQIAVHEINPNAAKREKKAAEITFREAFDAYMEYAASRAKSPMTQSTANNYRRSFRLHFSDNASAKSTTTRWADKPLSSIKPVDVVGWYNRAANDSISSANTALAVGGAVFRHCIKTFRKADQTPIYTYNPFNDIEKKDLEARTDRVKPDELPQWFDAVANLRNQTMKDYLTFMLLTGMRRREASTLTWDRIDLGQGVVTIGERVQRGGKREKSANRVKAGNSIELPLSDYLVDMLNRRRKAQTCKTWVFDSSGSKTGYIAEPKTAIASIHNRSGIQCSCHGLRRTYINIAHNKAHVPFTIVQRLVNHSQGRSVTERHYLNDYDIEDLRKHSQAVTDVMLCLALQRSATVTSLRVV